MLRRITRHPAFQTGAARLLGLYLAFVYRTTRWRILGWEHVEATGGRFVLAFWHEMLPLMPQLMLEARNRDFASRAHVLVSRHRDGRLIGHVVDRFGIRLVHASSSRGGAAGLLSLLRLTRAGEVVAITPDGPRGPRRVAAPGIAQLATMARLPVVAAAAFTSRGIRLRSWDRMVVPLPFGRAALALEPPVPHEAGLPAIEAALNAAAARAEAEARPPA
ncbi:lysophospholipid acyltransferase family protein [Sabulicella rubraurantiaca]|uniref:lysophospholipid acyltransferase family protein n=1 Tax=Sabulicella rubraurantiaca TaxID=2811429 RepID=UPI001A9596CC|nr:lysophospholipid acyltransferase family protein [Sabulicella rubraurantiaca]